MFRFYSGCIILTLIIISCIATANWTENLTTGYIQKLEEAQSLTQENQWAEASELTQEVYDHWNSKSFPLYTLLRHGDLDKIQLCFQSVSQYLKQEDEEPYTANNAQLITQLKLLAEIEQLSWENVL